MSFIAGAYLIIYFNSLNATTSVPYIDMQHCEIAAKAVADAPHGSAYCIPGNK